ncbi:hypothetical protein E1176_11965 [Fulvivirga sp. RKSG066]|uniref:BamA/TamA family outer membrane protein n=1 Tax=Fulvivirga aurantia TaxID=2529383 RepID=UPI0012BBF904|nr:BamA/TamA family outer membrane protein [Fulvivirga aurantia]MTI21738.1 hypothetical protein [Fulvivirga aurantia]
MLKANSVIFQCFILLIAFSACRVTPKPYSLNDDVKQDVESKQADSVVVVPGELYTAGNFKRFLLGDHYRDTWLTPIKVPVLDFETEKGGLEILDKGGGQQTYSLKLKAKNGKLYSLRSIQKDPSPTLPLPLQYSFADDIVQDQISASHPFGAFILPSLGDAAGIYHTNPKMVYIPDTPVLGKYREDFGGVLAMIEQDADEDWSDYEDFGYTENAVSTESVMEELNEDNESRVDQENLLRARLFDIWINDWDRHDGQFRWAELEGEEGKIYRPIPEDRDNVFFKFDGFIPWIVSRKWAMRKFQTFDDDIRDVAGLNHNARYLDRRFLTALSQEQWVEIANDLQKRLTDEEIDKALSILPTDIYALDGDYIASTLKARRDKLDEFARRYYKVLAKQVDIVGSDNNEYVEVKFTDKSTTVTVHDASDEGEKKDLKLYEREFFTDETDEIRIYTKGDEDYIYLSGKADKAPRIRIIGGMGEDYISDTSEVKGWCKNNIFYDNIEGTEVENKKETKLSLSNSLDVNKYDFKSFKYNYFGPTVFFGYNVDDGVYLGGGVLIKTHGFRKEPYASMHKIAVNVAPNTYAWNFDYEGDFKDVVGDLGLNIDASVRAPNFFTNFYGFGNETTLDETLEENNFYRTRFTDINFFTGITFEAGENASLKLGPHYQFVKVEREEDNFLGSITPPSSDIYDDNHYLGAKLTADVKSVESTSYPENGVWWKTELTWQSLLNNDKNKISRASSELRAYYSIKEPTLITFATRIGGSSNAGDFAFYQGNTIGGNAGLGRQGNVRGYARDRFTGRSTIYQNNEIRARLARIPFYYMPLAIGISVHYDQGRVWADNESSTKWHSGYGGGLWFHPLGKMVFTTTYTKSDEDNLFMLNVGFLF